jgi:hypothetical protein
MNLKLARANARNSLLRSTADYGKLQIGIHSHRYELRADGATGARRFAFSYFDPLCFSWVDLTFHVKGDENEDSPRYW